MELARTVYRVTSTFPVDERFELTNQLRRAAVSIASNIAEGKERLNTGELLQFLAIARGSALEVQTQLELAAMLSFGIREELTATQRLASEVLKLLNASMTTLRSKIAERKTRTQLILYSSILYPLLSAHTCLRCILVRCAAHSQRHRLWSARPCWRERFHAPTYADANGPVYQAGTETAS